MADQQAYARATLARLTARAPNGRADGRALHAYRFSRDDFELTREALRHIGRQGLTTLEGSAIFVAFAAEWFRRDRVGGQWDWRRPLAEIGQTYDQADRASTVSYANIASAVEAGLRWWRRPEPPSGDRIISIVKEAGFPASALRDNKRVTDWLKGALRLIERGFDPHDAVASEAWRMNAVRIADATHDAAVELCTALVDLRRIIRDYGVEFSDPISVLDGAQPDWRAQLPFELEPQDVASVVEQLIRATRDPTSALFVTRRLHRSGETWMPTATISLAGPIDPRRLPPRMAAALGSARRMRLVPRGALVGSAGALAALERTFDDGPDESDAVWILRPLVSGFEPEVGLDTAVCLGAMVGDDLVDEFPGYAGEGHQGEPVIFESTRVDDAPEDSDELVSLGGSSIRSKKAWLVIAAPDTAFNEIEIEGDQWELGRCEARRLVAFAGTARRRGGDGSVTTWRSAADRSEAPRMFLVGPTLRRVRETVYRGTPGVWLDLGDIQRECARRDVRWKPVGRGTWRSLHEGRPFGRIKLAAFNRAGELIASVQALVAPSDMELTPSRPRKGVLVHGLLDAVVTAWSGQSLLVKSDLSGSFIELDGVGPGGLVEMSLTWEASMSVTLNNPIGEASLVGPDGNLATRHKRLSLGCLHGYRAVTADPGRLCFELLGRNGPRRSFSRRVHGEAPLVAYLDDLRHLLGSSDDLDARVRLSWIGGQEWICEIGWYDLDPGDYREAMGQAFGHTRLAMLSIAEVSAFAIADPSTQALTPAGGGNLEICLRAALGAGPWLIWGRSTNGQVLRPRVLDDTASPGSQGSPFVRAVTTRDQGERWRRLSDVAADPAAWLQEDRRRWLDLLQAAMQAGLPYAALDPLKILDRHVDAAVWLLAFAETEEERRSVIAIQRELPFLWASSYAPLWLDAFEARAAYLDERLISIGLEPALASSNLLTALGQIADQAPDLAGRLLSVLLVLFSGQRRPCPSGSYEALAARLHRMAEGPLLAARTNLFVQRHVDGPSPPRGLGLAEATPLAKVLSSRFEPTFDDVIVAPVKAALAAFSPAGLNAPMLSACRSAWLFDPEHFDGTAGRLVADWTIRGRPPQTLELVI